MNEIQVDTKSEKNTELSLQLNSSVFADLILNFLGKKEKLIYKNNISFLIRLNDIEQFYHLVNQKMLKEQNIFIDHFLVNFTYSDGTTREISGIDGLNKFHETRDVIPLDVTLTWNIVVKYPNAETIENQKIELSFIRNREDSSQGEFILTINHTNQSWGIEILNLLKDKIAALTIRPCKSYFVASAIRKFLSLREFGNLLLMITAIVLMMSATYGGFKDVKSSLYYKMIEMSSDRKDMHSVDMSRFAAENLDGEDIVRFNEKFIVDINLKSVLNNIANLKIEEKRNSYMRPLSIIAVILILTFSVFYYTGKLKKYHGVNSYIIISDRSDREYRDYLSSKSKIEFYSISFIFFAVICSLIASIVFKYIF